MSVVGVSCIVTAKGPNASKVIPNYTLFKKRISINTRIKETPYVVYSKSRLLYGDAL